jgi:hypothetical protein
MKCHCLDDGFMILILFGVFLELTHLQDHLASTFAHQ